MSKNKCNPIRSMGEGFKVTLETYEDCDISTERERTLHKALREFIDRVNQKYGVVYILILDDS